MRLFGWRDVPAAGGGYHFTDRVRRTLSFAREEANRLRHAYVGTEHILLGLARDKAGEAARLLQALGVDLDAVRSAVATQCPPGAGARPSRPDLPYTSRAKKVLELAMTAARDLDHDHVGTEHLLLGLLREEKGVGARVLREQAVTAERVRSLIRGEEPAAAARPGRFRIEIDDGSEKSIYEQIVAQVQEAIATGRLKPGERVPTVRQLADELDIAPGTVARSYGELERLGAVVTDGARGTRIAERERPAMPDGERPETLVGLLRPVVVAGFHLGANAAELRQALEEAMKGIFGKRDVA